MKNIITFFALFLFSLTLSAQPTIQWQKALGGSDFDEPFGAQETTDGGYIAAGYTLSNNGDVTANHGAYDVWVIKFNSSGTVEWKKTYGGTGLDWAYAIQQTTDGGYIVAGYSDSNNGDVSGNHGDKDAWVLKLNNIGDIQWQKSFGGSGWDEAWSIRQTSDGGYIMAGRSNSLDGDVTGNHGGLDYWVVKLGNSGVIEWQRSLGGSAEDNAYSVRQTMDGGYILAGETLSNNGDVSGSHGDDDYWVVKLSPNGNLEWQKPYGGSGLDRGNDIVQSDDGGYLVVGQASSSNGDVAHPYGGYDIWTVKIDHLGNIEWQKSLGGSNQDWGRAIQNTSDGGYVITGTTSSSDGDLQNCDCIVDYWVVKLTSEGTIQWQKTLGGSLGERSNSICRTTDGGYLVVGATWSDDGDVTGHHAKSDFWVVKLSPESVDIKEIPINKTAPLEIYPNPTQQSISLIRISEEPFQSVAIYDLLGRELLRQTFLNGENLDVSALVNGLYVVVAIDLSGRYYVGKVEKEE